MTAAFLRPLAVVLVLLSLAAPASAQDVPLSQVTVAELNAAFDAGTLTSEALVERYLARIAAYDQAGPALNAVLHLNAEALETARALDRERREQGPRSPLHGIPVVLKDNLDTVDMPTTAGSLLLAGSIPPEDAFIVQRLREAGAILLAKVNMSEFAGGAVMSSVSGPMRNPHDLARTPSGSSGGTGVAVAASFGQLGIGTDTGGSIRGPSASNGIVGLKPTLGLLSRSGIVPLSLTFDTAGPMTRSVYDLAVMLGFMVGVDPDDPATEASRDHLESDYTRFLDPQALAGARIGVARDFLGADGEVDWVMETALRVLEAQGATLVEVRFPRWFLEARGEWYITLRWPDFRSEIEDYLARLEPGYPRTLEELIDAAREVTGPTPDGGRPNPVRWNLFVQEQASPSREGREYRAIREHGLPLARRLVEGLLEEEGLDAIVYPTSPTRPGLVAGGSPSAPSATNIANLTGFPDLIVPAGFTGDGLPVALSFLGPAFSEPRLLGLGYAFEQATRARRDPVHTPALPGEGVRIP
jgi:amidase